MPEQVQCPSCLQGLRVPDKLLGKKVKCPKCGTVFEAKNKADQEEDEGGNYEFEKEPEPEPEAKKKRIRTMTDDDDDDTDEDESDEEKEKRAKKRKRRHNADALNKVSAPATWLQVTACLGILLGIISVVVTFVPPVRDRIYAQVPAVQAQMQNMSTGMKVFQGVQHAIWFLAQLIIFIGASKMKRLESYGMSLFASIVALVPLLACCFVGLPVGIWSLVVINSSEVKPYFK